MIGAFHGIAVGALAMPMMPAVHPRMTSSPTPGQPVVAVRGGTMILSAPGIFGSRWGSMTPLGLVIGHVAYGVVAALAYSALI